MNGKRERDVFVESITLDKSEIVMNNYRPNIESNVLNEPKLCSKWCSEYFKKKDKTTTNTPLAHSQSLRGGAQKVLFL